MSEQIPFNRVTLAGSELERIQAVLESGQIAGNGPVTRECERILERCLGCPRVMLTTSCTHALEISALLLGLRAGDEVVMPSFTFVSAANAFALRGADIRFVDVREDTLNLDETALADAIGPRTRAVVPVHYGGVGCEMDAVMAVADDRGLEVVEDNAHGLLGRYRGRPLGTFGRLATLSFHATKNITCGEGGALLINDPELVERAEIIREKGTNRSKFFRGEVDKYTWVGLGSSYPPSELLAAFLLAQLHERETIQARRRTIWERYDSALEGWARATGTQRPSVPAHCEQAYHLYWIVLPTVEARTALIERLGAAGILAVFHYVPLHLSPVGRERGGAPGQCPVTERVADRLLRLPFYNSLSEAEQDRVIDVVHGFEP